MIVTDSSFIKILTFDLIILKREEENERRKSITKKDSERDTIISACKNLEAIL